MTASARVRRVALPNSFSTFASPLPSVVPRGLAETAEFDGNDVDDAASEAADDLGIVISGVRKEHLPRGYARRVRGLKSRAHVGQS
jgi:hypothetical protein